MPYLFFLLCGLAGLVGCTPTIDIDKSTTYKCGDKIIHVDYLDDDSVILTSNGESNVLNRVEDENGYRYDNADSQLVLHRQDGIVYFAVQGKTYPMCFEIKQ